MINNCKYICLCRRRRQIKIYLEIYIPEEDQLFLRDGRR